MLTLKDLSPGGTMSGKEKAVISFCDNNSPKGSRLG